MSENTEAKWQPARSPEDVQEHILPPKKPRSLAKKASGKARDKTRINIGLAFPIWRALREKEKLQFDSELAFLLLESYFQTTLPSRSKQPRLRRSSSTETCESVDLEDPSMMSSSNEAENVITAASAQESTHEKEKEVRDAACQESTNKDKQTTTKQSENKEIRVKDEYEDEEFTTTLSVADGQHLVDLGSASEFIVDEECILELFKLCRTCNRQCTIRKTVKGLKLVVSQTCHFCQNQFQWSNLPDEDERPDNDAQINGQNTATLPSSAINRLEA